VVDLPVVVADLACFRIFGEFGKSIREMLPLDYMHGRYV
jgi:hypothetical protein